MTKIFQAAKTKVVTRTLAVSALAVVGAAGVGAAPVHANPMGGGGNFNNTAITAQQNANLNANNTSLQAVQANYKQNTTYVYYNNQVEANYKALNYNNSNLTKNFNDYTKFMQTSFNPNWNYIN